MSVAEEGIPATLTPSRAEGILLLHAKIKELSCIERLGKLGILVRILKQNPVEQMD